MITLHHGSNIAIENIDLSMSKKGKDFGHGFYMNPNYNQAKEMASAKVDIMRSGEPIVSSFLFDAEHAEKDGIRIKVFSDYTVEWAEFIVMNRRNKSATQLHPYDIVIGPIADDKVGLQIRLFAEGNISVEKLIERIKYYGDKSIQYLFATEQSLTYLNKIR
ncbi:MAG: DUF3990 domain-containing protein [Muribaculaceae bacterium]|nr:DUF3990 domain-containing protein [Muribaculaceae bacterium]